LRGAAPPDDAVGLAERFFSREEIERARAYHRPLYVVFVLRTALSLGYLAALAFSPLGRWLASPVDDVPLWAYGLAYPALVVAGGAVLTFPIAVWRGYLHEKAWRFSTQTFWSWLADWAKSLAVAIVLTSGMLLGLFELASTRGDDWILAALPAAVAVAVILSFLAPVVFEPLFNKFRPLEDEALAGDLRSLAERAGTPVRDVLVADASRRTRKENAYVSGLGRTRRVVLFDTLLSRGSPRDIRIVVAHELGHRRDRHVVILTALAAVGIAGLVILLWALLQIDGVLAVLDAGGPFDPRVTPFVLLAAEGIELLSLPFGAAISRYLERSADRTSIELTQDPEGFGEMFRELSVANLSDLAPPRVIYALLFSHPSPPERIAAALTTDPTRT
jgi:STE24 endopeptidase